MKEKKLKLNKTNYCPGTVCTNWSMVMLSSLFFVVDCVLKERFLKFIIFNFLCVSCFNVIIVSTFVITRFPNINPVTIEEG